MEKYIRNGMLPVKTLMLPAMVLMLLAACSESDVQELFRKAIRRFCISKTEATRM